MDVFHELMTFERDCSGVSSCESDGISVSNRLSSSSHNSTWIDPGLEARILKSLMKPSKSPNAFPAASHEYISSPVDTSQPHSRLEISPPSLHSTLTRGVLAVPNRQH